MQVKKKRKVKHRFGDTEVPERRETIGAAHSCNTASPILLTRVGETFGWLTVRLLRQLRQFCRLL